MKRAFGVVCIICIIYLAALMIGFYKYELNEQFEIEQLLLSHVIDYSSDAAMCEALNVNDVSTDYSGGVEVNLDPNFLLDSFLDMFCLSYDIGISPESKNHIIQNYIPAVCVADIDGYYIGNLQPVQSEYSTYYPLVDNLVNSKWDMVFGPKMPYIYSYIDEATNSTKYSALNMGMNFYYTLDGARHDGLAPQLKNKMAGLIQINQLLTKNIADSINNANATNKNWSNSFFVPPQLSSNSGINPVHGPSLIILVQNVDLRTNRPISGFSISGSKVEKERYVIGYIRDGIKYYSYSDSTPVNVGEITDIFSSTKEAALAGYYCDLKYFK